MKEHGMIDFKKIKNLITRRRVSLLCGLIVIFAVLLASQPISRVLKERSIVSRLERLYPDSEPFYGVSLYSSENPDAWNRPFQDWISDHLGKEFAYPIDGYYLAGEHQITDNTISLLLNMKRMKSLNFSGTQISDKSLLRLRDFPMLRELQLYDVDVSDKTLEILKKSNPNLIIIR